MSKKKHTAPEKSSRKGIGVVELLDMFPDEESARKWFEDQRWPNGKRHCPHCGGIRTTEAKHKMPYHCKDCRKYFSVRTGTVMRSSKTSLRKWVAYYDLFGHPFRLNSDTRYERIRTVEPLFSFPSKQTLTRLEFLCQTASKKSVFFLKMTSTIFLVSPPPPPVQ